MARLRVSILVIGDEILGGFVQDTNSGWLAQRLQVLGVPLDRIETVPDETEAIGEALGIELARERPRLVLTSGGIGSTPDDLTLAAVASALGRELVRQPEIDDRVSRALEWIAARGVDVSEAHERSMRRMALVPAAAYLLDGARGIVPGIAVDEDGGSDQAEGATLVILPGDPAELRRITVEGIEPQLLVGRGRPQDVREIRHAYPESTLNPVLERLVEVYPDVHVGSYPGLECVIRLKGTADRVADAAAIVQQALAELDGDPAQAALRDAWQDRYRSQRLPPA